MVKLTKHDTLDLSDEFAATGYPGPYAVKTTTTGGKTGTEIIFIEVSPVSHPDVVIHAQTTMRDLRQARVDIGYCALIRNRDADDSCDRPVKRRGAQWKRGFHTPEPKTVVPPKALQALLSRLEKQDV